VLQINELLTINRYESLAEDPPTALTAAQFASSVREKTAPDGHFFFAIHCKDQTVRVWGDGPRSNPGGLTPEVGIAVASPSLQEKQLVGAIGALMQASFRWKKVPMTDITPVLDTLVPAQAMAYRRLATRPDHPTP
jgi:hypothetical protein